MVRTHDSKSRLLLAALPLLGVAFLVMAAVQGEPELARSPVVLAALAGLAALGALVAWWTARQLDAVPTGPVGSAQPGLAALSGVARPVPGAPPLQSPDGEACLWFKYSDRTMRQYTAYDSIRPFLLVDDSGSCIVLPAGADISGSSKQAPKRRKRNGPIDISAHPDTRDGPRLLCDGDALHVVARFIPASAESLQRQAEAAQRVEDSELRHVTVSSSDPDTLKRLAAAMPKELPPPPATPPLALPVLCDPGAGQPFIVSIGRRENPAGLYRFAAAVDLVVMLGTGVPALWQFIGAR